MSLSKEIGLAEFRLAMLFVFMEGLVFGTGPHHQRGNLDER